MKKSLISSLGFAALVAATALFTSCHKDGLTVSKSIIIYPASAATKSYMNVDGENADFSWKAGDLVYLFNITQGTRLTNTFKADKDGDDAAFKGTAVVCNGDKIALFYPSLSGGTDTLGTHGKVIFDIANQDGTLRSVASSWCRYGHATVSNIADETAVAYMDEEAVSFMGIVKFKFHAPGALTNVTRVCVSDIPTVGLINAYDSPSEAQIDLTYDETGFMDFRGQFDDGVYAGLFAGEYNANFYVTADGKLYEGSATVKVEKEKVITQDVVLSSVNPNTYSLVGGIKWALEDFTYADSTHFNWGVTDPTSKEYCAAVSNTDIEGSLYSNSTATTRRTSFHRSEYGDIVYKATKGKYRMPSYNDWYAVAPLYSSVHNSIPGIKLYWLADGVRIKDETNDQYIDLKFAGYRDNYGKMVNVGTAGYYMSGRSVSASKAWVLYFDYSDIYLTDTEAGKDAQAARKFRKTVIRPVVVE